MNIFDLDILALLGIGAFGGILGAKLFQLLRIPQVVGYIVIGVLIGKSGIGLINDDTIATLGTFNLFALGLIGFLVGGELHGSTFRKYGRQFSAILIGEGMGAFFLVGIPVTLLCWHFLGNLPLAVASGIVFGSISSATDPASTIDVLWEYRSRGILTTSLVAIVALDDALAMTLYGFGTSIASILTGGEVSLAAVAGRISVELFGAIALGTAMGFFLNPLLRWLRKKEQTLVLALAILLLVIGISSVFGMDIILGTMALGVTLTNIAPRRSEELFSLIQMLSKPIYVIFFVLVGARLGIGEMPGWFWLIIAVYVVARSLGKLYGAKLGGYISQAPPTVTRYCGYGLFAQGGVAVGLSIMAAHHLGEIPVGDGISLGDMIISAVTATTLIVQVIGPSIVKFAIRAADEAGRDITPEDVIAELTAGKAMDSDASPIVEQDSINRVVQEFATHAATSLPVTDREGKIVGLITLEGLKEVMGSHECWDWLLAGDVMLPVTEVVTVDTPLKEAMELMDQLHFERLAVVEDRRSMKAAGVLDSTRLRILISGEVLRRQQGAMLPVPETAGNG